MNKLVILFAVVAAVSAVGGDDHDAHVVHHESDVHAEGYKFSYETSNGVKAEEHGALNGEAIHAEGSFNYVSPEGTPVHLTYVADENGFQPQGAHLPVAPEVPEYILKAVAYNAAHPQKESH